jgi:hypothetical protein
MVLVTQSFGNLDVRGGKKSAEVVSIAPNGMEKSRVNTEGVGFEPTRPLRACRFSRPVP